ncbi:MAG: transposase [Lachnospiraceae bacterium]|nr:transposase [Lachnospiraceae bacterium]
MPSETIFKTVYQYNRIPILPEDMRKLQEIAEDCRKVRNYVYERYGGPGGLKKIYPGYTVQNEMTASGLRERLGLPSVYFYLSIFDALGDIKSQWSRTKSRIEKNIQANGAFTPEDRHYLRFAMKQSRCFEAIVAGEKVELTGDWEETYRSLCGEVDVHKLNQYLRRQVRKHLVRPHTDTADGFTASPKGYRYGDHGIYLSMKESRKRLFILLTDNNRYTRQIYIRLFPEEGNVTINVPVEVRQRHPAGYTGEMGLAVGMRCMFATDRGTFYGERYLEYQSALTNYIQERLPRHRKNAKNNPGMKKYNEGKARLEAALHAYVNAEINRMLETEKPAVIYYPKLPGTTKAGANRKVNATINMWQKGFVKSRLTQKCRERSIKLIEVFGKGISVLCSRCGGEGAKDGGMFCCKSCGLELPERQNTAANVLKRGKVDDSDRAGKANATNVPRRS